MAQSKFKIPQPKIYSCQEWGAKPPVHTFRTTDPKYIIIHHMVTENRMLCTSPKTAKETAFSLQRECQQFHMEGNGWADTGQHFTVSRDGVIMEGRHGSLVAARDGDCILGAHAADPDTGANENASWGIECEGTYTSSKMPLPQWNALVALCTWLSAQCLIDSTRINGHRETGCRTACPGDWLYGKLPDLRTAVHDEKLKGKVQP